MKRWLLLLLLLILTIEPACAGPGGKIASAVFETFWGKLALVFLTLLFLPLIAWTMIQQYLAERRARADLRFLAAHSPLFDWLKLQERAKTCFQRVHSSWEREDLSEVSEWMTDWYWQNQQLVHLQRWKRDGLQNVCELQKIRSIRPLLLVHRNDGAPHAGSMVVLLIDARMRDYLRKRATGDIVEGSKTPKDVETIWSFTLVDGCWKVSDINESSLLLVYTRMRHELPAIETTLLDQPRAG